MLAAWFGGALLLLQRLNQGWLPHDDGSMAHSARRIIEGQLPHRDFAELYTGGLAFLDAGIFWAFGEDLFLLRIPLFILFVAYVPCFYALARRFLNPGGAFLATLFAISWSVLPYPAPMPSWYLLFFAVFGAYAVVRYFEGGHIAWLFVAGLFGGLSIGFKITGVWFVVAVIVALAAADKKGKVTATSATRAPSRYRVLVATLAVASLALVIMVLRQRLGIAAFVSLLVPVAVLCAVVLALGHRGEVGIGERSSRGFLREASVFLGGLIIPLFLVALPYLVTGSLGDLIDGVLIAPQSRFEFAYRSVPGPAALRGRPPWCSSSAGHLFLRHVVECSTW